MPRIPLEQYRKTAKLVQKYREEAAQMKERDLTLLEKKIDKDAAQRVRLQDMTTAQNKHEYSLRIANILNGVTEERPGEKRYGTYSFRVRTELLSAEESGQKIDALWRFMDRTRGQFGYTEYRNMHYYAKALATQAGDKSAKGISKHLKTLLQDLRERGYPKDNFRKLADELRRSSGHTPHKRPKKGKSASKYGVRTMLDEIVEPLIEQLRIDLHQIDPDEAYLTPGEFQEPLNELRNDLAALDTQIRNDLSARLRLIRRRMARLARIEVSNHLTCESACQVLGLVFSTRLTADQVREAQKGLCRKTHPDLQPAGLSEKQKQETTRRFMGAIQARKTLLDFLETPEPGD